MHGVTRDGVLGGSKQTLTGRQGAICINFASVSSRSQLIEQSLRFLQIARVEPFGEPAVNRGKQFACLLYLTLVAPEAREAHSFVVLPNSPRT